MTLGVSITIAGSGAASSYRSFSGERERVLRVLERVPYRRSADPERVTRRRLRRHARETLSTGRRTAEIRGQRLARVADPAGDHAHFSTWPATIRNAMPAVERLHAVNTRAIDLTEALLLLSRADQRPIAPAHVDVSLIAEEATEPVLPLTQRRGVTIETSGDATPTTGSHALLLLLTTNLVQNAIVHNLPEQGTVWITTSAQRKGVVLTVENTGEKLTQQLVATLAEPIGTERTRTGHAGVGLGLAIVKSITQALDGTSPSCLGPLAGSASRCNYPRRHRTSADDDQGPQQRVRPR